MNLVDGCLHSVGMFALGIAGLLVGCDCKKGFEYFRYYNEGHSQHMGYGGTGDRVFGIDLHRNHGYADCYF